MTLSQKRAISYAINQKRHDLEKAYLICLGLYDDYKKSKYKYMCNYIKFELKKPRPF